MPRRSLRAGRARRRASAGRSYLAAAGAGTVAAGRHPNAVPVLLHPSLGAGRRGVSGRRSGSSARSGSGRFRSVPLCAGAPVDRLYALNGRRALSCLALAVAYQGAEIVTANGLADGEKLHPLQQAFVEHDGFQCGYCTPGQIVSAFGMLQEAAAGWPSVVTKNLNDPELVLSGDEIRERMSGNLCRCAAYANIVPAIAEVAR